MLTISQKTIACDCNSEGEFLKVAPKSDFVSLIKVTKYLTFKDIEGKQTPMSMEVEIIDIYKGKKTNKPIIAVDPDGKKIVIVSTNPEFRAKAFADLQKLTSTQLVLLKNGQVIEAHKLANFPKAYSESKIELTGEVTKTFDNNGKEIPKSTGTENTLQVIQDENTATIREVGVGLGLGGKPAPTKNETQANGNKGFDPKSGGGDPTIFYDSNSCGDQIANEDGTYGRSPQSGLNHELNGHGLAIIKGEDNMQIIPTLKDPDTGTKGSLDNGEMKVRTTIDQKGRVEQGDSKRDIPK